MRRENKAQKKAPLVFAVQADRERAAAAEQLKTEQKARALAEAQAAAEEEASRVREAQRRAAEEEEAKREREAADARAAERLAAEQQADELLERFEGLTHVDAPPREQEQAPPSLASPDASSSPDATSDDCVICMAAAKTHILVPCGHQCVCGPCADKVVAARAPTCPICREPAMMAVQVYK